jgi:hypothetical protein
MVIILCNLCTQLCCLSTYIKVGYWYFFHVKTVPGNNSGLTKIEIMLGCALQIGERTKVQQQNGFIFNY